MCQPFFVLFWVESKTCSLFVPRLVLFVLFSWVEDKKVHVLPSSSLGEGAQFSSAERVVPFSGVVKRPSLWLHVIIQEVQLLSKNGPPASVTRNTRTNLLTPGLFFPISVQVEKKSLSIALSSRNSVPPRVYFHPRPASGSRQQQPHWANAKQMPSWAFRPVQPSPLCISHRSPPS